MLDAVQVGIGQADLTPPAQTPSAGYQARKGAGMEGIHDPLYATALLIDNGSVPIVFCSVDHLGFTYEMYTQIRNQIPSCQLFLGSTHTHSGGGAFLNIPLIGESIAGPYNPEIAKFYIDQTVKAIREAFKHTQSAYIGIGYGEAIGLSYFRATCPQGTTPLNDLTILKVVKPDGTPLAVLFNFPVHPTILTEKNRLFSADFVGYARKWIKSLLGDSIEPIYFNGAQGDINPLFEGESFAACDRFGHQLAQAVAQTWKQTDTRPDLAISISHHPYSFVPQATPQGLKLPLEKYDTEINLLVLNQKNAFVTIPGELSCVYDRQLKAYGQSLGYTHVSFLGLCQDAHGYIIIPEAWRSKTFESQKSFGGEEYGEKVQNIVRNLLKGGIHES